MPGSQVQPFASLPYSRISMKQLAERMRRARLQIRLAMSPDSAAKAIIAGQKTIDEYETMAMLARLRFDLQTGDRFYQEEREFYDTTDAEFCQMRQELYAAMVSSRYRGELEKKFGQYLLARADNFRHTTGPAVVADLVRENKLETAYRRLMSQAQADLGDKSYSLSQLEPLLESSDRPTRILAWKARSEWLQDNQDELDDIFAKMAKTRAEISKKLGFDSFADLGRVRMERTDYGPGDISDLRDNIIRYIVPLTGEIRRLQRRRLNLEHLYSYDLPCLFPDGNPQLQCNIAEMPWIAARVIGDLTQRQSFLEGMISAGYIDLPARPGKVPGSYCATLKGPGQPFIFMNANGTAGDVFTLLHEAGHAFAGLRGLTDKALHDLHLPALDACEIHSTTMEYLAYPYMDRFFGQAAEQASMMHMTATLLFLPYGCLVDEFQQRIYTERDMSAARRHALWREMEQKYLPDLDHGQDPFFSSGRAWQLESHIYTAPFYYIDYVLGQIAALDIWQQSRIDQESAFGRYDLLCSLGGSAPFLQLLESAGISSPFSTSTIKRLAYAVCDYLSL